MAANRGVTTHSPSDSRPPLHQAARPAVFESYSTAPAPDKVLPRPQDRFVAIAPASSSSVAHSDAATRARAYSRAVKPHPSGRLDTRARPSLPAASPEICCLRQPRLAASSNTRNTCDGLMTAAHIRRVWPARLSTAFTSAPCSSKQAYRPLRPLSRPSRVSVSVADIGLGQRFEQHTNNSGVRGISIAAGGHHGVASFIHMHF